MNSLDIYSPPLSHLKDFNVIPVTFSAYALNVLNAPNESLFFFKGRTTLKRERSSIKVIQYINSPFEDVPTECKSEWTNPSNSMALVSLDKNGFACIFPARHSSQTGSGFAAESITNPSTKLSLINILISP